MQAVSWSSGGMLTVRDNGWRHDCGASNASQGLTSCVRELWDHKSTTRLSCGGQLLESLESWAVERMRRIYVRSPGKPGTSDLIWMLPVRMAPKPVSCSPHLYVQLVRLGRHQQMCSHLVPLGVHPGVAHYLPLIQLDEFLGGDPAGFSILGVPSGESLTHRCLEQSAAEGSLREEECKWLRQPFRVDSTVTTGFVSLNCHLS